MFDTIGETNEFRVVLGVAEALRREFGEQIDAHPGGVGSEPGAVNRAFRVTAEVILGGLAASRDELAVVLAGALRQAALRRLVEVGVAGERAEGLIDEELGLGDAWLAYLTLAPAPVIEDMIGG